MEINKRMRDYMSMGYGIKEAKELADHEIAIKEQISKEKIVIQDRSFQHLPRKSINKSGSVFSISCVDHLGNVFPSLKTMTKHYGLSVNAYQDRLRRGWCKESALTTPLKSHTCQCLDHLGNKFASREAMFRYYKTSSGAFLYRIRHGFSFEEALTMPSYSRGKESNKNEH